MRWRSPAAGGGGRRARARSLQGRRAHLARVEDAGVDRWLSGCRTPREGRACAHAVTLPVLVLRLGSARGWRRCADRAWRRAQMRRRSARSLRRCTRLRTLAAARAARAAARRWRTTLCLRPAWCEKGQGRVGCICPATLCPGRLAGLRSCGSSMIRVLCVRGRMSRAACRAEGSVLQGRLHARGGRMQHHDVATRDCVLRRGPQALRRRRRSMPPMAPPRHTSTRATPTARAAQSSGPRTRASSRASWRRGGVRAARPQPGRAATAPGPAAAPAPSPARAAAAPGPSRPRTGAPSAPIARRRSRRSMSSAPPPRPGVITYTRPRHRGDPEGCKTKGGWAGQARVECSPALSAIGRPCMPKLRPPAAAALLRPRPAGAGSEPCALIRPGRTQV